MMNDGNTSALSQPRSPSDAEQLAIGLMVLSLLALLWGVLVHVSPRRLFLVSFLSGTLALISVGFCDYDKREEHASPKRKTLFLSVGLLLVSFAIITAHTLQSMGDYLRPQLNVLLIGGWLAGMLAVTIVPYRCSGGILRKGDGRVSPIAVALMYVLLSFAWPVSFSMYGLAQLFVPGLGTVAACIIVMRWQRASKTAAWFAGTLCVIFVIVGITGNIETRTNGLTLAIVGGDIPLIEKLIASGQDVQVPSGGYSSPVFPALHYGRLSRRGPYSRYTSHATWKSQKDGEAKVIEILEILFAHGAKVNLPDNRGFYPIHVALTFGMTDVAKMLVREGADLKVQSPVGETVLHEAILYNGDVCHGAPEIIAFLIEHGADANALDAGGNSPLHHSCYLAITANIEVLLEHGANPNVRDSEGHTPLEIATKYNRADIAALLRRYGAKE
jgi:hypothetical protein